MGFESRERERAASRNELACRGRQEVSAQCSGSLLSHPLLMYVSWVFPQSEVLQDEALRKALLSSYFFHLPCVQFLTG